MQSRIVLILAAILSFIASPSSAQDYPNRPVTLIVPWPAGGTTDIGMPALASATEKHLKQKIVVENRPGAGGVLGPQQVAQNAAPDGYTLVQIPITVFRFPFMRKTSLDPATDFTYIIGVSGYTFGVVVRNDAPWKTFKELIDYARANPGKINYGTPGAGTTLHITMEQIAKQQGIKWKRPAPCSESMSMLLRTRPAGRHWSMRGNFGCWSCGPPPVARTGPMRRHCAKSGSTWCQTLRSA